MSGVSCAIISKKNGWEVSRINAADFGGDLSSKIEGSDMVINLAGAPIIGRWSEEYKKTLESSRIETASKLVQAICAVQNKPKSFFSASAVGYYEEGENDEYSYKKADDFFG